MVSKTPDVIFLNRMFSKSPKKTKELHKKQDPDNTESGSVRQDKRGDTVTTDSDANDDASATASVDSSVPDTPTFNSNPGRSKYRHTYRCTMHDDPTTGHTIGAKATALANHYQCLEEADEKMEFSNIGAGLGGGLRTLRNSNQ